MSFNGIWQNRTTKELIILTNQPESDDYTLEYDNDFKISETIQIFVSNSKHALLPYSNKFGRQDISILSPDSIKIGDIIFDRHVNNK